MLTGLPPASPRSPAHTLGNTGFAYLLSIYLGPGGPGVNTLTSATALCSKRGVRRHPRMGGGRRRWRSRCAGGTPPTGMATPSAHSRTRAAPVTAAEVIRAVPLYGKLSQATQRRAPQFQSETRGRKRRVLKRRGSHAQCCVGATCLGWGRPGPQDVNQQE